MKSKLYAIAAIIIAIYCISMIFPHGCIKPDETKRVLVESGYSNVEITGWRAFAGEDFYATGFRATSLNGKTVTGVVTSGFLKGNTIRLD